MTNMYNIIESLCKEKGITITEMCRDLKINRSSLSELKQGRAKSLSVDKVVKIANYFNASTEYITGVSNERNIPIPQTEELSNVYLSLAKEAQNEGIDPQDIRLAIETIKKLRNK